MNSSVYCNDGKKTDFSQLGWVAAWVLDESAEVYHDRKWVDQPELNEFIKSLVTKGVLKKSLKFMR